MLRILFMHQWFGLSDPAMDEALHDVSLYCEFARLDHLVANRMTIGGYGLAVRDMATAIGVNFARYPYFKHHGMYGEVANSMKKQLIGTQLVAC